MSIQLSPHRTPAIEERVVRLPCGHEDSVPHDASMMALSVSVLRHIASCRVAESAAVSPWAAAPGPASREVIDPRGSYDLLPRPGGQL